MHLGKQWETDQVLGPAPMVETWMNLPASNPGPALANEPMDRYDLCVCVSLSLSQKYKQNEIRKRVYWGSVSVPVKGEASFLES